MRGRGIAVLVSLMALASAPFAEASYPGANGRVLLERNDQVSPYNRDIWSVNPDGTGAANITNTPAIDEAGGSWSPDGTKIAFIAYPDVWTMNADGTNRQNVTPDVSGPPFYGAHVQPTAVAWSPDGERIAISNYDGCATNHSPGQVILIGPDGSNPTQVVCRWPYVPPGTLKGAGATGVSWHPNGQRLALAGPVSLGCEADLWTVNRDATGLTDITTGDPQDEFDPDWAPDGSKIVFEESGNCGDTAPLWTVNPDGSGKAQLTNLPPPPPYVQDVSPVWAPDRSRVMFFKRSAQQLWTVDSDGGNPVNLTEATGITGYPTSWLAIPQNAYPRPKGATPTRVSFTTAYSACTSPDRTHGPPLAFGSCASPQRSSQFLTVGTGDSNGKPALNEGSLVLRTLPGAPGGPDDTDVALEFSMDDVFTNTLADYSGELRASIPLRITDKDNTPNPGGPGAATVTETALDMVIPCTPVADPNEGSSCTSTTTVDALIPGAAPEGKRAVWSLGRIAVYDGGPDGDANTPAGDTLFATQGIFIP